MLERELVSLIVPFYNGERYLERFLKSLISQSYNDVQIILIDDGSTDNSDIIVSQYLSILRDKFAEVTYLKQSNGGAASAVNMALKYVKGEYLCWADCDDELYPENIKKKYLFLKDNPQYGMVNCGAQAVDQDTGEVIDNLLISSDQRDEDMFLRIISGIPVYPGVFMLRTELLFRKLKDREIYFNREAGQNYQLLLPVAYDNKCGFIDDILYKYYVRSDSHSHNVDYYKVFERTYVRESLLDNVLVFMPEEDREKIINKIYYDSEIQRFNLSFEMNDKLRNNESFKTLKKNFVPLKVRIKHYIINCKFINTIYRWRR